MSKVVEKAEEVKKDVADLAEEAGEELQEQIADLANKQEKKPNGFVAGLKKYGGYALAFGFGWGARTLWTMLTGSSCDSTVDAGNVVDVPVAGTDNTVI